MPPHEKQDQGFQPLEKFAEALGISPAALARYRRVAAAWPRNKRDSHTSWSVHAILAGHPDRFDLIKHPPPGREATWTCEAAKKRRETKQRLSRRSVASPGLAGWLRQPACRRRPRLLGSRHDDDTS
ncbi:DUF6192 family protein [Streptomyces sp. NBC_00690]|uniref:DUF6192 family protein n=1 Tax=Streptomyces sp. NBC_00690 TaxID=2975808 RepID=UPI003FA6AA17